MAKNGYKNVSDTKIGKGGTNMWYLGSLDSHKSLTVVYELANPQALDNVKMKIKIGLLHSGSDKLHRLLGHEEEKSDNN